MKSTAAAGTTRSAAAPATTTSRRDGGVDYLYGGSRRLRSPCHGQAPTPISIYGGSGPDTLVASGRQRRLRRRTPGNGHRRLRPLIGHRRSIGLLLPGNAVATRWPGPAPPSSPCRPSTRRMPAATADRVSRHPASAPTGAQPSGGALAGPDEAHLELAWRATMCWLGGPGAGHGQRRLTGPDDRVAPSRGAGAQRQPLGQRRVSTPPLDRRPGFPATPIPRSTRLWGRSRRLLRRALTGHV